MTKSIAIVQTSQVSSAELKALCTELIPDATVYQIIDDSLIDEVVANNGVTRAVRNRLYQYYRAAESLGVDAILNQCSSVGEVVDVLQPLIGIPIVKVDQEMARRAVLLGPKIAVIATVESTVGPSTRLIENTAKAMGKPIQLEKHIVKDAMMVLIKTGDRDRHNSMVLSEIQAAAQDNDVIVLAQGSMTVIEPLLSNIGKPVLTSPRLGVEYLKKVLEHGALATA